MIKEGNDLLEYGLKILHIKHGLPGSDLQLRHADFLVWVERITNRQRLPIPIQVKSSERYRRIFEREIDKAGLPHIGTVVVRSGEAEKEDGLERIKKQVIQCIKTAVDLFNRATTSIFDSFRHFSDDPESDGDGTRSMTKRQLRKHLRWLRRRRRRYFNYSPIHHGHWRNRQCGCFAA